MKRVLLLNPPISDVAAFDMWARPLGLLVWGAWLRRHGIEVSFLDATDRAHPAVSREVPASKPFHTGKYPAVPWPVQPDPARKAARPFRRYGMLPDAFNGELARIGEAWGGAPDAIMVGSRMTYWYHGVVDAVERCRRVWPGVSVALGGVYAALCPDHAAARSGADAVFGSDAHAGFPRWLREVAGVEGVPPLGEDIREWPRPAFDLCADRSALPILTSRGCPMGCSYCASRTLHDGFSRRPPDDIVDEVRDDHARWGTTDFAFYDDALLVDADRYFVPAMRRIADEGPGVRFHMPNGVHYWMVSGSLACLMRRVGVRTVRLSLESVDPAQLAAWGRGGSEDAFRGAVAALREAGFSRREIGVYIMAGIPGQDPAIVERTMQVAWDAGALPRLNEFSPIPGSGEWARAVALSGGEVEREPLWQNNSLYWIRGDGFPVEAMRDLKAMARKMGSDAAEADGEG